MELTRLQKAYVITALMVAMKQADVKPDLKLSEAADVLKVLSEETEMIAEGQLNEVVIENYQDALRKVYESMVTE